jgi:hypothetical protein
MESSPRRSRTLYSLKENLGGCFELPKFHRYTHKTCPGYIQCVRNHEGTNDFRGGFCGTYLQRSFRILLNSQASPMLRQLAAVIVRYNAPEASMQPWPLTFQLPRRVGHTARYWPSVLFKSEMPFPQYRIGRIFSNA